MIAPLLHFDRSYPVTSSTRSDGDLREAFELFSQTSAKLAETYAELQGQVARLSAELAAANGELARRERLSLLGEVAAKLAHQLRTPLAAALLYAGHLARPTLAETERLRLAEKMIGRMRYLERLIQDMLLFVKGQQAELSVFSVQDLVQDLMLAMTPQADLLGVHLRVEAPAEPIVIEAHRQAIEGALINLLENAIQASPAGGCVRFKASAGGPFIVFRVEDEGEGIPEASRARLFEPFFTTRAEGSGLGLAIVKQTAEAHGGWVEVESGPDRGSAFVFYLARQSAAASAAVYA
jgi:two-component system sensor histidine kinase FlrB